MGFVKQIVDVLTKRFRYEFVTLTPIHGLSDSVLCINGKVNNCFNGTAKQYHVTDPTKLHERACRRACIHAIAARGLHSLLVFVIFVFLYAIKTCLLLEI